MARSTSPLRYPGGKSCLYDVTARILRSNRLDRCDYAEPYAGGCGLALLLLFGGHASDIHINDLDPAIWAFWKSVLDHTDELVDRINGAPVNIEEWHRQKAIHDMQKTSDVVSLGFATFYLNRTNRSGIIKGAGVIGGLAQNGNYKIDCRFNKQDLIKRIRRIRKYRSRINLTNLDAIEFLKRSEKELPSSTFFCIDPPYYNKGSSLYTSAYSKEDHSAVADAIIMLDRPWIVTYDDTPEIRSLYKPRRQFSFDIKYSVQTKRIGTELLVASKGLRIPNEIRQRQVNKPQYRAA